MRRAIALVVLAAATALAVAAGAGANPGHHNQHNGGWWGFSDGR